MPKTGEQSLTEPGIFVPTGMRENLMKEEAGHGNPEVQTGADRDGLTAGGSTDGEWKDSPAGMQGSGDSRADRTADRFSGLLSWLKRTDPWN